jgi:hypothetical protein
LILSIFSVKIFEQIPYGKYIYGIGKTSWVAKIMLVPQNPNSH